MFSDSPPQRSPPGRRDVPVSNLFFVATVLALAGLLPASRSARGADAEEKKVYLPVAPETEYFQLRHLMGNGMMPNYKAVWYCFRHEDVANLRLALRYISSLTQDSSRYALPEKKGTVEDFRLRMADLRRKADGLSADVGPAMDRSAVNERILSIYQTCQSCHDLYAPAERQDARKYSPPR